MARPIKRLHGELDVVKDLRRRSRSTTIGVRDWEGAEIILLRLDGVGVEAVAERLKTRRERVSLWSGRFEALGLEGLEDEEVGVKCILKRGCLSSRPHSPEVGVSIVRVFGTRSGLK